VKKRNVFVFVAALLVISMLLGQFGTAVPIQAQGNKTTVRLLSGAVGQELEITKAQAARYMKAHPDVTIEVFDTPAAVQDRLGVYLQYFQAKSADADLYQIDVIWPGDLAEHLVDLNEYGAKDVATQHFPAIIQNNTVGGKLVGLPWFTDAGLLYYRTDLLTKYGLAAPPKTWVELQTMATTIQDGERKGGNQDFWGFVWQGNSYEGLTCDALEWIYANGGGTIISPDKMITINNPNAVVAIDGAAKWVGGISPKGVTGFQEEDARHMWEAGNAAFMRNWPYCWSLGNKEGSAIKDKFDVTPLPTGASGHGAATLGGWQLAVSKYSKNPKVAADVALFMTSKEEQKIRAIDGSFNPTIMDLYKDPDVCKASPFMCKLYDVFVNAVARPSTATAPKYNEVSTTFFKAVHDVLTAKTDAKTAVEEMELDLQKVTGFKSGPVAASK
jgi:trehalose/maltose transport system substrate-binding protein